MAAQPAGLSSVLSAATTAAVATSLVTSVGRPASAAPGTSLSLIKWTLPFSLFVTVLGFWWHSSRKKPKPPEEEEASCEERKALVGRTAACNGASATSGRVTSNGVCKAPPTDNPDLAAFIETVKKLNSGTLDTSAPVAKPTTSCTTPATERSSPVAARKKRSAPQPCTPPSVEKQVVARSAKYAQASVLDTLEFGVAQVDSKKRKSPTDATPVKKLWSELVEEDSESGSPPTTVFAGPRPRQCSIDALVTTSSDARGEPSVAASPPCCDSTTESVPNLDLSQSPRDYHNTKSYSESAANAEVATIITSQPPTSSPMPGGAKDTPTGARTGQGVGRDSANHSPGVDDCEAHPTALLSSPSLSDVHSEGSSDSGKGCSEEGSSRTPAGGSSVSGDAHPTTPTPYDSVATGTCTEYHFILPQHMVGRLIGKEGVFIHRIRNHTNTKMYIKRHPTSHKLKICAIEGPQENIDQALSMIRQKFSLSQYPFLTLEKVDYIASKTISCTLRPEPFHLTLVEGINNDVCISSLVSAGHFFVQLPSHPTFIGLQALNLTMNQIYSANQTPLLPAPVENALVAVPAMGGWFRAQIISVDAEACACAVRFVDYGGYLTLPTQDLRQIRADFLSLPFQAIECGLANVLPVEDKDSSNSCDPEAASKWSDEALSLVHGLTRDRIVQVQVYDYDVTTGMPLVYVYSQYNSEYVLVNQELVMRGYAKLNPTAELLVNGSTESPGENTVLPAEDSTSSHTDKTSVVDESTSSHIVENSHVDSSHAVESSLSGAVGVST